MENEKAKAIKVLKMIQADMKNGAENFDGKPFNGRNVAEYFGNQGAAISALAGIVKTLLTEEEDYCGNLLLRRV